MTMTLRLILSALFLGLAGSVSAGEGQCEMSLSVDPVSSLLHATYDTPELCFPQDEPKSAWRPRWVLVDMGPELTMEVMNYPHGRRQEGNQGWYMRPLGPVGGPYLMQARSGYNGGRAGFLLTINPDGSLIVVQQ